MSKLPKPLKLKSERRMLAEKLHALSQQQGRRAALVEDLERLPTAMLRAAIRDRLRSGRPYHKAF
ncbi:hypothetical protein HW532_12870 [Kaustia mangrovi]|uniref:Uncharacterized protein n=1 Tax=Kaustia mangrovi TaxID=2593653 RepID=A0A7S8C4Y8_9HYPH|nr:hypothetical protein [Kaustia mangrovi]QPC43510.1 hypothetical protein HW532_12870 [Kaustia mangrovi]